MRKSRVISAVIVSAIALCAATASFAAGAAPATKRAVVGTVDSIEGAVTVTRQGSELKSIDIGDTLENYDLVKTGPDGYLIIKMAPSTGMSGSMTIKPKAVVTLNTTAGKGSPATEANLISGAIALKVKKLSGEPTLQVRKGSSVMGVRGTQFEVVVSVNDSILVSCSEGRVACGSGDDTAEAIPGQIVEQKIGERFSSIPVAVSSLEAFRDRWINDEIEAFRAAPLMAVSQYAASYRRLKADFLKSSEVLLREPVYSSWVKEFRSGTVPRSTDPDVMKAKSAMAPKLMAMRGVLFQFEPIYYRLDQMESILGPETLGAKLPSGETVREFYDALHHDFKDLERKTASYRFALSLYALHNDGKVPLPADDGDAGDFFADDGDK